MLIFDNDQLYRDLIKHTHENEISQNQMLKNLDVARSTLHRLGKGKPITMETFLKLVNFTKKPITRYIKKPNKWNTYLIQKETSQILMKE